MNFDIRQIVELFLQLVLSLHIIITISTIIITITL